MLLVLDSMTGQDAVNVAEQFQTAVDFDGIVLTKLDGDARGGAALSVRAVTGKPIKLASVGEKLDALEEFHPDRMACRILGMGDVLTLIEKAEIEVDDDKAKELERKLRKADFTLEDMLDQFKQIRKMGSLRSILGMLPGIGKQLKGMDVDEKAIDRVKAMILSMTPRERQNPGRDRRLAPQAHRHRLGHERPAGQPAAAAAQADEEDDEAARVRQDARHAPARRGQRRPDARRTSCATRKRGRR